MKPIWIIGLCTLLTACVEPTEDVALSPEQQAAQAEKKALYSSPDRLRAFLQDTTVKTWIREHGTQIEYHSTDGRTWLVYPGNTRSVQGEWKIQPAGKTSQICYRYGKNTYNPVTGQKGGKFHCKPAWLFLNDRTAQAVDGDVLKLRGRGEYPQPLPPKTNLRISTVMKAIGLGELKKPNKFTWYN